MKPSSLALCTVLVVSTSSCELFTKVARDESSLSVAFRKDASTEEPVQVRTNGFDVVAWGTGLVDLKLKLPAVDEFKETLDLPDKKILYWDIENHTRTEVQAIDLESLIEQGGIPVEAGGSEIMLEAVRLLDASWPADKAVDKVFILPSKVSPLFTGEHPHPSALLLFNDDRAAEETRIRSIVEGEIAKRRPEPPNT